MHEKVVRWSMHRRIRKWTLFAMHVSLAHSVRPHPKRYHIILVVRSKSLLSIGTRSTGHHWYVKQVTSSWHQKYCHLVWKAASLMKASCVSFFQRMGCWIESACLYLQVCSPNQKMKKEWRKTWRKKTLAWACMWENYSMFATKGTVQYY